MEKMKRRILVAEDERKIALDIKRVLEKAGNEVISVAASALDVIEKAEKYKPDIIFEGTLDGIEAEKIITYKHPVPVVFISALRDETTMQRTILQVPTEYVKKPFKDDTLLQVINTI